MLGLSKNTFRFTASSLVFTIILVILYMFIHMYVHIFLAYTYQSIIMLSLQASSPPTSFCLRYLSSHAQWLSTHSQLLATCVSLSLVPPPSAHLTHSIEKKVLTRTRYLYARIENSYVQRCTCNGIIVVFLLQFRLCISQFQQLSQQYDELYKTLFDADPSTLEYIKLYPQRKVYKYTFI